MERVKKVARLDNEIQAQLLDSILTDREIPHIMHSYHDTALDGIFQTAAGWGQVEAPPEFHGEILAVLDEIAAQAEQAGSEDVETLTDEDISYEG